MNNLHKLKSIVSELQSVQPQAHPTPGSLFHLEYSSNPQPTERGYIVDETNIEETKIVFRKDDIVVGDVVRPWDDGGWGALAGRAGEDVVRDGNVIHKRLTRMS